jgi:urate oxidase
MLAEWGVFTDDDHPGHQQTVFEAAMEQMAHYPRLKAIVYFSSPNAEGRNSEVDQDAEALEAFRSLMRSPYLDVRLDLGPAEPPK